MYGVTALHCGSIRNTSSADERSRKIMDFDAAIFDLDGTLLNSMDVWEQIDIRFLRKRNLPVPGNSQFSGSQLEYIGIFFAASCFVGRAYCFKQLPDRIVYKTGLEQFSRQACGDRQFDMAFF